MREHDLNEIILEERKMVTGVLGLGEDTGINALMDIIIV